MTDPRFQALLGVSMTEIRRGLLSAALEHCEGSKPRAAALLGISLKTLYNWMREFKEPLCRLPHLMSSTRSGPVTRHLIR